MIWRKVNVLVEMDMILYVIVNDIGYIYWMYDTKYNYRNFMDLGS